MVTADGGLDSVIDGRWRLARVDGTKSQGQRAKKSCTITGPKTTQKGKVFSRGILHQTYLVSEKSRLVKQKIHPQDAIGLDVLPSNLLQPWFYLSVLYSEKLLLDVTRWWTKATDLMCTSWASNNKGQIQYTTKATLCNTNIHNEPLHKMRDYKSWPNLRVCIFKNLLIQFSPWGQLLGLVCIAADSLYVKVRPIRGTIGIWTSGGDPGQSPAKNSMRGQLWPLVLGFPFMFSCLWSMTDKKWFGSFSQKVESSCCFHTVIRIETTIHASFSPENRFLHAVCMAIVSNFKAPLSPANFAGSSYIQQRCAIAMEKKYDGGSWVVQVLLVLGCISQTLNVW